MAVSLYTLSCLCVSHDTVNARFHETAPIAHLFGLPGITKRKRERELACLVLSVCGCVFGRDVSFVVSTSFVLAGRSFVMRLIECEVIYDLVYKFVMVGPIVQNCANPYNALRYL